MDLGLKVAYDTYDIITSQILATKAKVEQGLTYLERLPNIHSRNVLLLDKPGILAYYEKAKREALACRTDWTRIKKEIESIEFNLNTYIRMCDSVLGAKDDI